MSGAGSQIDDELLAFGLTPSRAAEVVIAAATDAGLVVTATGPTQYRLSRTYRPGWVVPAAMVGAIFLGLGLLLLLLVPKRSESCTVMLNESRRGVTVKLSGLLPAFVVDQIRVALSGHAAPTPTPHGPVAAPPPAPVTQVHRPSPWAPISSPPAPTVSAGVEATVARGSWPPAQEGVVGPATMAPLIRLGDRMWSLSSGIVVGRNPAPIDQLPGAQLVSVGDAGLSKTHLAIRLSGSTIEVCDLSSTNGTAIEVNQRRQACSPETWIAVGRGVTIVAGDQRLEVVE